MEVDSEKCDDDIYLSPSELVDLKVNKREYNPITTIGNKFNKYEDTAEAKAAFNNALKDYESVLKKKRAAQKSELIQAEWSKELNSCITNKMKGKFAQHMGKHVDGKIILTPEESVFLLENGCIEIVYESLPLSTESAYNIILQDEVTLEKYQVYSYLSQLGFILVPHQIQFVESSKEVTEANKLSGCTKRKLPEDSADDPKAKRLTFSGILSDDHPVLNSITTVQNDLQMSSAEEVVTVPLVDPSVVPDNTISSSEKQSDEFSQVSSIDELVKVPAVDPSDVSDTTISNSKKQLVEFPQASSIDELVKVPVVDPSDISDTTISSSEKQLVEFPQTSGIDELVKVPAAVVPDSTISSSEKQSEEFSQASSIDELVKASALDLSVVPNNVISSSDKEFNELKQAASMDSKNSEDTVVENIDKEETSGTDICVFPQHVDNDLSGAECQEDDSDIEVCQSPRIVSAADEESDVIIEDIYEAKDLENETSPSTQVQSTNSENIATVQAKHVQNDNIVDGDTSKPMSCVDIEKADVIEISDLETSVRRKASESSEIVNIEVINNDATNTDNVVVLLASPEHIHESGSNSPEHISESDSNSLEHIPERDSNHTTKVCNENVGGVSAVNDTFCRRSGGRLEADSSSYFVDVDMSNASPDISVDYMDIDSQSPAESRSEYNLTPSAESRSVNNLSNDLDADIDVVNTSDDMSCSAEDGLKHATSVRFNTRNALEDDDVTCVEITKKETVPLDVIDLLSDEGKSSEDEIEIVDDCPGPSTSGALHKNKSAKVIPKEFIDIIKRSKKKEKNFQITQKYPETQENYFVCFSPPPTYLLPTMKSSQREAAIVRWDENADWAKTTEPVRVWESYHDLARVVRNRQQNRRFDSSFVRPMQADHRGLLGRFINNGVNGNAALNTYHQRSPFPPFSTSSIRNTQFHHLQQHSNSQEAFAQSMTMANRPSLLNSNGSVSNMMSSISQTVYSSIVNQNGPALPPNSDSTPHFPMHNGGGVLHQNDEDYRGECMADSFYPEPFPCTYRERGRASDWLDVKRSLNESESEGEEDERHSASSLFKDTGSNIDKRRVMSVLYTGNFCSLYPRNLELSIGKLTSTINVVKQAIDAIPCCANKSLQFTYDIYLPGTNYKKTCPGVPKYRLIVQSSYDPLNFEELKYLLRKWNDSASLEIAVVDNGNISFFSCHSKNTQSIDLRKIE